MTVTGDAVDIALERLFRKNYRFFFNIKVRAAVPHTEAALVKGDRNKVLSM